MTSLLVALLLAADAPTVHVVSNPDGAAVLLDATAVGTTPVDVQVPPGRHTLTVTHRDYPALKRPLKSVKPGETLRFDFLQEKTRALEAAVAKAQREYDAAETRLTKAQESGAGVEAAETKMADAVRALESAERALEDFKKTQQWQKPKSP